MLPYPTPSLSTYGNATVARKALRITLAYRCAQFKTGASGLTSAGMT